MITIQGQPAADTLMETLGERLLLPVSTLRTVLTRVGRVDCDVLPTSICCFVGHVSSELRPGRILNTLCKAMIVHHLVDRQVFNGNDVKAVDGFPTLLMGEVPTSVTDAFMHPSHDLAALHAFRRTFCRRRQFALGPLQVFLVSAQELWAWGFFTCRERRKAQQSDVNAYGFARRRQWLRFNLTDNRGIPLASRRTAQCAGFRGAFQRAMVRHTQCPDLGRVSGRHRSFGSRCHTGETSSNHTDHDRGTGDSPVPPLPYSGERRL